MAKNLLVVREKPGDDFGKLPFFASGNRG